MAPLARRRVVADSLSVEPRKRKNWTVSVAMLFSTACP